MIKNLALFLLCVLLLVACQSQKQEEVSKAATEKVPAESVTDVKPAAEAAPDAETASAMEDQTPPTPPLYEDFQAKPKLSLFPRAGAFRPELDDEKGLQFWRTYIDHLMRTSGPIRTDDEAEGNLAFSFRAIKGVDSVGVFSPIAVEPETNYKVSAKLTYNLEDGATAGIGLLEFNKFMWIGEQYPESLMKEAQVGTQKGINLTGKGKASAQSFTFTTGPETRMIHLVFFRDGTHDRNQVVIDDIGIEEVKMQK